MRRIVSATVASLWLLSGTSMVATAGSPDDPYEATNRSSYASHQALYGHVIRPVATFYNHALPEPARAGIHNFLVNANLPVTFGNDLLQARFLNGAKTLARFAVNTTVGIGGFIDVAKHIGIPEHETDFADTLADYGVGSGPYLYIPVLGPSVPRELGGKIVDAAFDPLTYVTYGASIFVDVGREGATYVDKRARGVETADAIERESPDPYVTTRILYEKHIAAESDPVNDFDNDRDQVRLAIQQSQPNSGTGSVAAAIQQTQPNSGASSLAVAESDAQYCSTVADERAADAAASRWDSETQQAVRDRTYKNCTAWRTTHQFSGTATQEVSER